MMTWGIADFVDEKTGESDGKFSMTLNFPNPDYSNPQTNEFLEKMKKFENQILDDAVKNSEAWFGEELSREVVKHNFFPILKYSKDKMTKKIDLTKPPSIRGKVPNYDGKWGMEIYDTASKRIFPCDNDNMTPIDFIPKKSQVAVILQCGGLWFGGKGFGLTFKVIQAVVKPQELQTVFGKCHIQLSPDELKMMDKPAPVKDEDDEEEQGAVKASVPVSTEVEDSDEEPEPEKEVVAVKKEEPVAETKEEEPVVVKKKTVVKKKVAA
jgi:hypothetical protein